MAIAASGAVSFSDLRTEFVGGSSAISMSDLYRGGSNIKAKAGDNQATNLAASVPASGVIDVQDFYSTAKGFKYVYSSTSGNQNFSSLFGDDYDLNYPKIVDINSGVSIYGQGTDAITIPSGLAGGLTLNNAGTIYGFGGAANGGAGGNCINNASSGVVINNTANIFAGGGGGGLGGTGGNGTYSSSGSVYNSSYKAEYHASADNWYFKIGGTYYDRGSAGAAMTVGGTTYSVGSYHSASGGGEYFYRLNTSSSGTSSGGSGGSGGIGQGYNQTNTSGSAGAAGGTNAGTGGTGGAGATYGTAGSTGSTGANGNSTNGSAGVSGGAAGAAVTGTSVTMNNTGTVHGAVA